MKKSLSFWQFAGFVFTSVFGTLLHFLYDWTNNTIMALFSGVNESVWEHMKILFFPMFIFALIQSKFFAKQYNNFWVSKLFGIFAGLLTIPLLYYTYKGALGVSADWFNILIYYIAAAISYLLEIKLLKSNKKFCFSSNIGLLFLCLLALLFMIFTFTPPRIPLFQDPLTKLYGLV